MRYVSPTTVDAIIELANVTLNHDKSYTIERKAWRKFKQTYIYAQLDEEQAQDVFTVLTGKEPTYTISPTVDKWNPIYNGQHLDEMNAIVRSAVKNLTCDPTSVHDLCGRFASVGNYSTEYFMRKLFYDAAEEGIIKKLTIKTCGRTCINLYYI